MRIKHWSGYGCVNAKRINDGAAKLHVRVSGQHECGLERGTWDTFMLYHWLVKRFDKTAPEYREWVQSKPIIDMKKDFENDMNAGYVEVVDYYFHY